MSFHTAWLDEDKGGDVVKVRYLVDRMKTKLYMVDKYGVIVHKQPISLVHMVMVENE